MRKPLAPFLAFGLAAMLAASAHAQNNADKSGDSNRDNNRDSQKQTNDQGRQSSDVQWIRGVIAGVTAEGEVVVDYRTKQAVMTEAAYATVIGSPARGRWTGSGANDKDNNKDRGNADDRSSSRAGKDEHSGKHRDNVYIVWLSPKTKVYDASSSGTNEQKSGSSDKADEKSKKKEVTLEQLEVGDRVEIQFVAREDSTSRPGTNQTDQMRRKHGRHRTYVGDANSITILASRHDENWTDRDSNKSGNSASKSSSDSDSDRDAGKSGGTSDDAKRDQ